MSVSSVPPRPLPQQPWFLLLLAAYAVLELSFNHRLLELADASGLNAADLHALERWARVVSGLGLGLLLVRWLARWVPSRLWLVLGSMSAGLLIMWHVQKSLVDAIVARADEADLRMSVHALASTSEALKGRLELRGQPVLDGPAPAALRPVMGALWASSVLGLEPQDLESTSGAGQLAASWMTISPDATQMRNAYRRAVMAPVALGASLLFGLLNLCQLFAGLTAAALQRWGPVWLPLGWRRGFMPAWVLVCVVMSLWPGNVWTESAAYREVARPAMWQDKPFLAPFVDWSLRAEPAWADPVAWVHQALMGGFEFRDPARQIWPVQP